MMRDLDRECCDNCNTYSDSAICKNRASDEYMQRTHKQNWCIQWGAKQ